MPWPYPHLARARALPVLCRCPRPPHIFCSDTPGAPSSPRHASLRAETLMMHRSRLRGAKLTKYMGWCRQRKASGVLQLHISHKIVSVPLKPLRRVTHPHLRKRPRFRIHHHHIILIKPGHKHRVPVLQKRKHRNIPVHII